MLDTKIWIIETRKLGRAVLGNMPIITGSRALFTFDIHGSEGTEIFTKKLSSHGTKGLEIHVTNFKAFAEASVGLL